MNRSFDRRQEFVAVSSWRDGAETRSCLCTAASVMRRVVRESVLKNDSTVELRFEIDRDEIGIAEAAVALVINERVVIASWVGDGSRRFHTDASSIPATSPLTRVVLPNVPANRFTDAASGDGC